MKYFITHLLLLITISFYAQQPAAIKDSGNTAKTYIFPDSIKIYSTDLRPIQKTYWDKFWDRFVGLGSAIVGLTALIVSYLIAKMQIKSQVNTTIKREWIEKVRDFVSKCLLSSSLIIMNRELLLKVNDDDKDGRKKILDALEENWNMFNSNKASLFIYLNSKDKLEGELFKLLDNLNAQAHKGDRAAVVDSNGLIKHKLDDVVYSKLKY